MAFISENAQKNYFMIQSIVFHNLVKMISRLSKLQGNSEPPALEREVVLSVEDTVAKIKGPKHRWIIIMTVSDFDFDLVRF